jgi:hypothetical protein
MSDTNAFDQGFDPYRFGRPVEPVPASKPTGKAILGASWRLMRTDPGLVVLPLMGAVLALVGFVILFVPGFAIGRAAGGSDDVAAVVGGILGLFVASATGIFFQAALVAGASMRADGIEPTLGTALAAAGRHWRQILGWAALSTVVGTTVRVVEQRLGIIGTLIGFLGGLAWAIATFFAVPVLVIEGVGPIEAVKRSSGIIKQVWGTSVRTTLRFGIIQVALVLVPMIVLFAGVITLLAGPLAVGAFLVVVGALALIGFGIVLGAISTYARTLIYRYATGRPVPGIEPALFAGAFRPKRRWRG